MLEKDQATPDFILNNQNGESITLSTLIGKSVILYFYPKDDTPGCTLEGKDFSALKTQFEQKNAIVFGISKDSVDSHAAFCGKYHYTIDLLSDPDMKAIAPYGVWQEKKNYGKTYMGIVRSTYLISPEGTIQKVWKNVKVEGHAQAVLDAVNG